MTKETENVTDDAVSNILAFSKSSNAGGTATAEPIHLPRRQMRAEVNEGLLESAERAVVLLIEELGSSTLSRMSLKDVMFLAYLQGSHDPMAGILLQELKKC